jgi:hypothetical protein
MIASNQSLRPGSRIGKESRSSPRELGYRPECGAMDTWGSPANAFPCEAVGTRGGRPARARGILNEPHGWWAPARLPDGCLVHSGQVKQSSFIGPGHGRRFGHPPRRGEFPPGRWPPHARLGRRSGGAEKNSRTGEAIGTSPARLRGAKRSRTLLNTARRPLWPPGRTGCRLP